MWSRQSRLVCPNNSILFLPRGQETVTDFWEEVVSADWIENPEKGTNECHLKGLEFSVVEAAWAMGSQPTHTLMPSCRGQVGDLSCSSSVQTLASVPVNHLTHDLHWNQMVPMLNNGVPWALLTPNKAVEWLFGGDLYRTRSTSTRPGLPLLDQVHLH